MKLVMYCMSVVLLTACGGVSNPPKQSKGHINTSQIPDVAILEKAGIPKVVASRPFVPVPKPFKKPETYTVVVNNVPLKELLFAIARDSKTDIDIVGEIDGTVTLNAIDKTLVQLLERIARHTDIKYQFRNNHLIVEKDAPYLKTYQVDYLNIERNSSSSVQLATQINASGATGGNAELGNNSSTTVTNTSVNAFWRTIESNINQIVFLTSNQNIDTGNADSGENQQVESSSEEGVASDGSSEQVSQSSVIVNKESGLISVYTTSKNHKKISEYIDLLINKVRQQVLIEATIVEVELNNQYKSGVDWSIVNAEGLSLNQTFTAGGSIAESAFTGTFTDPLNAIGNVTATIRALEEFGDVQILSSPKVIAINNQIAIIKVVDNRVYFTTSVAVTAAVGTTARSETFRSTLHTVPVGFVMNVTPSISNNREIILNVRPTISRILNTVLDPNPDLATAGIESRIPEIQVREMETILRMNSGQTAIIGGLMQDKVEKRESGIPGLNKLPVIGFLFGTTEELIQKTELLIFIKATIVGNASVDNELKAFYDYLPNKSRGDHLSPSERN